MLRFPVSGPLFFEDFSTMIQMMPTAASMRILQSRLNIHEMDLSQLLLTDPLESEECDALLRDKRSLLERPFYSNGDSKWARSVFLFFIIFLQETGRI